MKSKKVKLTAAQAEAVSYIEENKKIPLSKVNRHTVLSLVKMGVCDYNNNFDALALVKKPVDVNTIEH